MRESKRNSKGVNRKVYKRLGLKPTSFTQAVSFAVICRFDLALDETIIAIAENDKIVICYCYCSRVFNDTDGLVVHV